MSEVKLLSRLGLRDQIPQDGTAFADRNQPRPDMRVAAFLTGTASEELATCVFMTITSSVEDMLELTSPNESRSCLTLHSDIPISHKAAANSCPQKRLSDNVWSNTCAPL